MSRLPVKLKSLSTTAIAVVVGAAVLWLAWPPEEEAKVVEKQVAKEDILKTELAPKPVTLQEAPAETPVAELAPLLQAMPEPAVAPEPTPLEVVEAEPAVPKPAEPKPEPEVVKIPEAPKTLDARQLLGSKAVDEKLLKQDLEAVIESGEWLAYRDQLQRSVEQSVASLPDRVRGDQLAELVKEPAFSSTLLRWKMLKLFPPSMWTVAYDIESHPEFCRHLLGEPAVMEEVLMTVQSEDDVLAVLPMMQRLWASHSEKPELAAKYSNLALACAVVFDQPLAYVSDTASEYSESATGVDADTRYRWYVDQNEGGLLEVGVHRSSARDLVFVVCAPVPESELTWAMKEYRSLRRKAWGRTYGDVEYLMERAVDGLNPYDEYTLEQILEEGGICGDQTHFAVNTARAAGIPALGLSGTTDSGPHAWAAIKIEDDEWSTEIGRIKGVSRGSARDPQTGQAINEQDIWMWSSREYRRASRKLDLQRQLWLSQMFGELGRSEQQREVVMAAAKDGEPYPEYWQALYEAMKADPKLMEKPDDSATLAAWEKFCEDLKREFKENPRMSGLANEVEQEQLFPHMELKDIRRQLSRDRRRQQREAAEQVDLVTDSLKREADWIWQKLSDEEEGDEEALREISQLYDRSLREYGKSVSGFATMADDYFEFIKDEKELGPKAVRDIELAFKRVVDTDSDDWFRANTEMGIHRRICEMYRHVGEHKKADVMERRLEAQMERARRKAL